jgi:hypothetical protein
MSPPLALVPRFTEDDIRLLIWAILGLFVLAVLTPVLLHLNHRLEVWRRSKKDREYNEELIKLAVKEGRRAAEEEAAAEAEQSSPTTSP